ncbi:diguanylate cyclase (GGDEF)-like protein [Mycobacterium frederiksbergense]|uniref:Diguanylate cyclase (GGDEF)-like protein n=1 Tax=Mycolicibacterium frederiksbergense TaxID=117567 RepID=A0ABT6KY81_9MYCO|nr:GGDEF domain-containing protein [Mycolicibacterium frederiksbergense]MDH6195668.1 diguanylate cyclase (GGDEF)-like protein [Mycolicibacterium frederiksbergense]
MAIIDMRTVMLFIAAVHLLLCVLMRWGTRNSASPALVTWSASNFLAAAAWLLIAVRDIVPDWASIPVANSLLIFSWALLLVGMQQFAGKKPRWCLAALPACTVFTLFMWVPSVNGNLGTRVMVVNTFLLLCLLVLIALVVRDQKAERLRARLIVLIAVAVAAGSNVARAIMAGQLAADAGFLHAGAAQELGVFVQGLALLGWGVGLILMNQERLENRLHEAVALDPLTDVLNRRGFEQAVAQAKLTSGAVAVIDIDRFKNINDSYGHDVGDQVLRESAMTLRGLMGPGELVCRYGGEEFCLLLKVDDEDHIDDRAEDIRTAIAAQRLLTGGDEIAVTASIGVAVTSETTALSLAQLMSAADEALYRAKREGRDRVVIQR